MVAVGSVVECRVVAFDGWWRGRDVVTNHGFPAIMQAW